MTAVVVWWTPDCRHLHVETNPVTVPASCPDGIAPDPDPLWAGEDGYLVIPEPVLRPGFLRRLVAAVAAWWRG